MLADFTVERWTGEKWTKLWGIANAPSARVRVRQIEYGVVPDGYSEYVPPKQPTLANGSLYKVLYEGGPVRGGVTFAVVERDGKQTVVELDAGKVLPRGELVYSGMRLSGKPLPPFVTVKWGVGIGGTGFYGLHAVEDDYFLPPYTYGQVSVQRGTR